MEATGAPVAPHSVFLSQGNQVETDMEGRFQEVGGETRRRAVSVGTGTRQSLSGEAGKNSVSSVHKPQFSLLICHCLVLPALRTLRAATPNFLSSFLFFFLFLFPKTHMRHTPMGISRLQAAAQINQAAGWEQFPVTLHFFLSHSGKQTSVQAGGRRDSVS